MSAAFFFALSSSVSSYLIPRRVYLPYFSPPESLFLSPSFLPLHAVSRTRETKRVDRERRRSSFMMQLFVEERHGRSNSVEDTAKSAVSKRLFGPLSRKRPWVTESRDEPSDR